MSPGYLLRLSAVIIDYLRQYTVSQAAVHPNRRQSLAAQITKSHLDHRDFFAQNLDETFDISHFSVRMDLIMHLSNLQ